MDKKSSTDLEMLSTASEKSSALGGGTAVWFQQAGLGAGCCLLPLMGNSCPLFLPRSAGAHGGDAAVCTCAARAVLPAVSAPRAGDTAAKRRGLALGQAARAVSGSGAASGFAWEAGGNFK